MIQGLTSVQLTANLGPLANPSLALGAESLQVGELDYTALGSATLDASGGTLAVDNIGTAARTGSSASWVRRRASRWPPRTA
jgi:hypothetical protein